MKGRTMYVVPYVMGPLGSPFSKVGIEVTDSPYVVANMRIMTRMGTAALAQLGGSDEFVPGLHSTGDLSPDRRYIVHYPEERLIWSVGSGYGGNALLGKKCFALRIASTMARDQGWMAEHMLILELTLPDGEVHYVGAAFPSACGKTNLAMLQSPFEAQGYRVRTIGDDIAWLRPGPDGRLWAVNPEAGFFGVVPGTGPDTNPMALETISHDTIFTNVAVTPGRHPVVGGQGQAPARGPHRLAGQALGPHRQGRRTRTRASRRPRGSARPCRRGGRTRRACRSPRSSSAAAARAWRRSCSRAATGTTASSSAPPWARRRPRPRPARWASCAAIPWPCCRSAATTWATTSRTGWRWAARSRSPPAIFHVNWFRTDKAGRFLWPGFGENLRVLLWMIDRVKGQGKATETPVGLVPTAGRAEPRRPRPLARRRRDAADGRPRRVGGRGAGDPRSSSTASATGCPSRSASRWTRWRSS